MVNGLRAKARRRVVAQRLAALLLILFVTLSGMIWPTQASAASPDMEAAGTTTLPVAGANEQADLPTTTLPGYVYAPIVVNKKCRPTGNPSIFGVQMYGNTGRTSPLYAALTDTHADWVRVAVSWSGIEPKNTTPANYDWSSADRALSGARDACVTIIATHDTQPEWAATYTKGPVDKVPLAELQQYFRALVERYDGDGYADAPGSPIVNYWEMFNEPDAWCDCSPGGWGLYPEKYAAMLKAVYPVIKDANPNAQVLMGGLFLEYFQDQGGPFVRTFLDDVLKAGGGDYFDIMNHHTYVGPWSRLYPALGIIEKTEEVRATMAKYGVNKPVMITETGFHSNQTAYDDQIGIVNSPEMQARYVPRIYARGIQGDIQAVIWWPLADISGWLTDNGLVSSDTPPEYKPAITAYQAAVEMLATAGYIREFEPAETESDDAEVIEFYDPTNRRTIFVAWLSPVDREDTQAVRLSLPTATVYDLYGNVRADIRDADDGKADGYVTVPGVGAQPIYIVGNH